MSDARRKRILVCDLYMEIGGAERALIGLLETIDKEKYDVDLFLNQHTGEFMSLIPAGVNLLPPIAEYTCLLRPVAQIVREGHIGIAVRRLWGLYRHSRYRRTLSAEERICDDSVFQYVARSVSGGLPDLRRFGRYDLAISFRMPHNIVLDKVDAAKKVCWIHTDYRTVHLNKSIELPIWGAFDHVISISDDVTASFLHMFPELRGKMLKIENILPSDAVVSLADYGQPDGISRAAAQTVLLSVGRYCTQKNFQVIPAICRGLLDRGLDVKWYIIGYGTEAETKKITDAIAACDISDRVVLLGKKTNPYPYIKACDWYVQPSLFEGKSIAVREAQILHKPVIITNYPTAHSQITHGVDGVIVPMAIGECIAGIAEALSSAELREKIIENISNADYTGSDEIQKIYSMIES